jgi:hypothetical protein
MPPKHRKHRVLPADRLALAITGLKTGKYTSIHEAATQNAIPESTLRARVKSAFPGRANANTSKTTRRKEFRLTKTEENTLYNWIIQVHEGGNDISPDMILAKRGGTHGFRVTPEWVSGYLEFNPELAALVEKFHKALEEIGGRRVWGTRPEDPESALKTAEDMLHNATLFAREMNDFEKDLQQRFREMVVTEAGLARVMAVDFEGWRAEVGKSLERQTDSCREMFDATVEADLDLDTDTFVKGYHELVSIISDTKRVQEEIRMEFGGKGVSV